MQATEIVLPGIGEPESLQIHTREVGPPGPVTPGCPCSSS
jgi:hypothetical protein